VPGELIGDRLQPKTRARIAAGIARYWGPMPYCTDEELHTTESGALAVPVEGRDGKEAQPMWLPLRTQTTRAETAMVTPFVAELRGGGPDARSVLDPAATFGANGNHHALVTPSGGSGTTRATGQRGLADPDDA
jgi:DNA (cytosine-5)-methyltransferase 1